MQSFHLSKCVQISFSRPESTSDRSIAAGSIWVLKIIFAILKLVCEEYFVGFCMN
jgi:hypothetical protein